MVLERRPLGQAVHVFSHIRMTMKVERILLQVRPASTAAPCAPRHGCVESVDSPVSCCALGLLLLPRVAANWNCPAGPLCVQGNLDVSPRAADEATGVAALQWVPGGEMEGKGLSSGVKKVSAAWRCAVLRCAVLCPPFPG